MPSKAYPHPEERRRARLEGRKTVMQPFVSIFLPSLICETHRKRPQEMVSLFAQPILQGY